MGTILSHFVEVKGVETTILLEFLTCTDYIVDMTTVTYLTISQAAERARRSYETIRRNIAAGKLRSTRVGRQHLISEDVLEQWLRDTRGKMVHG